jgi:diacylglycerol kinase family enzyme
MQHLFIVNPIARQVKGRLREITGEIETFFRNMAQDNYHIHITRWARDCMGFVNRFAQESPVPVRIHAMGGSGILYEVINGTIGLPNVQIAAYPMGGNNYFIHYFGKQNEHMFKSLEKQIFSCVTPIDAFRYENNYGISYVIFGLEAAVDREGDKIIEETNLPIDFCYKVAAVKSILRSVYITQHYNLDIDGTDYSGDYISILIAGGPCYGNGMTPAREAHPNDGILDIYLFKAVSRLQLLKIIKAYTTGMHKKLGELIIHARGRKISLSAEKDIIVSMDGEKFYERSVTYEVVPAAIDFVCPHGIDVKKLPRIYARPEEGLVVE